MGAFGEVLIIEGIVVVCHTVRVHVGGQVEAFAADAADNDHGGVGEFLLRVAVFCTVRRLTDTVTTMASTKNTAIAINPAWMDWTTAMTSSILISSMVSPVLRVCAMIRKALESLGL